MGIHGLLGLHDNYKLGPEKNTLMYQNIVVTRKTIPEFFVLRIWLCSL
jgi:hypothetical protein